MEITSSPVCYLIILANVLISIKGFQDPIFLDNHLFKTGKILHQKEYKRLFFAGFLHADWMHLLFNMYSLYSFGRALESYYGSVFFTSVYFLSLFGGNLLSLFLHKNEDEYAALGASGAVCGAIFSSILVIPGMEVSLYYTLNMPGWLYAVLFALFSIYGIKTRMGNIGHDAHLGGAIIGAVTTLVFNPYLLVENTLVVVAILLPSCIFLYLLIQHPNLLGLQAEIPKKPTKKEDHSNQIREDKQKELNRILDKITAEGINSLSDYEKRFLDMNQ